MVVPVWVLALAYILATIFSVTPRISFWGSYQRLQGTYTTFSYLVIFVTMIANLRQRVQVERLITTMIIASLPVSLYGYLQRVKLDPVPWGGNVSIRVAANMGNSIFVAAYLIMAFPLTVGRLIQSLYDILRSETRLGAHIVRATLYLVIAVFQVFAIVLSGSRGPMLGFVAGLFFIVLLFTLYWRKRVLTFAWTAMMIIAVVFLYVLQIPGGPLSSICKIPGVGRFCLLLDPESNSALVRKYIWEGAANLVAPHEPISFPNGSKDNFNFLRPLIGYGPESMYVAYNPFYVPELGQVEKRNASPDRSHNETWDSIVITGGLGLAAYLLVFVSVFYFSLKWMGVLNSPRQRNLFILLCVSGGLLLAIGVSLWRGVEYVGVGLPYGVLGGLGLYLMLGVLFFYNALTEKIEKSPRAAILIMLLATVIAHFVEINFGIAIAVTRTYFWVCAALIVLVGYILPRHGEYTQLTVSAKGETPALANNGSMPALKDSSKKLKTQRRRPSAARSPASAFGRSGWMQSALIAAGVVSILLMALGYDFISKNVPTTSVTQMVVNSFTLLPSRSADVPPQVSYGILGVVLIAWLTFLVLWHAEDERIKDLKTWGSAFGASVAISLVTISIFWLVHAGNILSIQLAVPDTLTTAEKVLTLVARVGGVLTGFYIIIFLLIFALALILPESWPSEQTSGRWGLLAAPAAFIVAFVLINVTNLRIIHADIAFKMAEPYAKGSKVENWRIATEIYRYVIRLAPDEDHYYLFLGRSYLEQAKLESDATRQEKLVLEAEGDLKVAQGINPLNTDHTANLGRLYSWWSTKTTDAAVRKERALVASDYYGRAVTLSPQNSNLWGEWALLFLDVLKQPAEAYQRLSHALDLDQKYSWTQGLMGSYYLKLSQMPENTDTITATLEKAASHFDEAANVAKSAERADKIRYLATLGDVYLRLKRLDDAIAAYERLLAMNPKSNEVQMWKLEATLAQLYYQKPDKANAQKHISAALEVAPEDQRQGLQALATQIEALP
jgi:tetratricopeptide (TPR) repeat protein